MCQFLINIQFIFLDVTNAQNRGHTTGMASQKRDHHFLFDLFVDH